MRVVREQRPHVMTTYDENGGYPHPDHIRCHEVSVAAFEAAGDPDRFPDAGRALAAAEAVLQPHLPQEPAREAAQRRCSPPRSTRPYAEWLVDWEDKPEDAERLTTSVPCAEYFAAPRRGAHRARHPGRPDRSVVRLPDRAAAGDLALRGLPARAVARRHDAARGRPVRRRPRPGDGVSPLLLAVDAEDVSAGPLGLLVVVLMIIATVLLIRNMNARLRRLPREFPEQRRTTTARRRRTCRPAR